MMKKAEKLRYMVLDAGGPLLFLLMIGVPIILIVFVTGTIIIAVILITRVIKKKHQEKSEGKEVS